jgi:photosystem II stability/assembly factor-like uncharacterized protein
VPAPPAAGGSLSTSVAEPAGAYCEAGGTRVSDGIDTNGNGTLDPTEPTTVRLVCNVGTGTQTWLLKGSGAAELLADSGVIVDTGANATLTLPDAVVGTTIRVKGLGAWTLAQRSGQSIDTTPLPGVMPDLGWTSIALPTGTTGLPAAQLSSNGETILLRQFDGLFTETSISRDAGSSWSRVPGSFTDSGTYFSYLSADGLRAGLGIKNGVSATVDAGTTWAQTPHYAWDRPEITGEKYSIEKTRSVDGRNIVAIASEMVGVSRTYSIATSNDSGASWTARQPITTFDSIPVIGVEPGGRGVVVFADRRIYVSTDGGTTFATHVPPFGITDVLEFSGDGRTVYAAAAGYGVWASTDGGISWTLRLGVTPARFQVYTSFGMSDDGRRLVVGGASSPGHDSNSYWFSDDGGATWQARPLPGGWVAISGNGKRLAAMGSNPNPLWLSTPLTTRGESGYVAGAGGTSIELRYEGNGNWSVVDHRGPMFDAK